MNSPDIEIRTVGPKELDELVHAQNEIFSDYIIPMRSSREFFLEFLRSVGGRIEDVIVACSAGRIIGYANPVVDGDEAWIGGVGVVPDMRRSGIGAALMVEAERSASERGAREVILEVIEGNLGALRLYERLGYVPCATYLSAEGRPIQFEGIGEVPRRVPVERIEDLHAAAYADNCWQRRKKSALIEAGKGSEAYMTDSGFVVLRRVATTGFLTFLGVRPDMRGRGVGTTLAKFAMDRLWELGVYKVAVYNVKDDAATLRMLDKFDLAVTLKQIEMRKVL